MVSQFNNKTIGNCKIHINHYHCLDLEKFFFRKYISNRGHQNGSYNYKIIKLTVNKYNKIDIDNNVYQEKILMYKDKEFTLLPEL